MMPQLVGPHTVAAQYVGPEAGVLEYPAWLNLMGAATVEEKGWPSVSANV